MNIYDRNRLRDQILERANEGSTHWEGCWEAHPDCAMLNLIDYVSEVENHYFRALDEIFLLRTQLAYEARVREADLGLKTYPKSRRRFAEEAIERMRTSAQGGIAKVAHALNMSGGVSYRRLIGERTLTRWEWENEDG